MNSTFASGRKRPTEPLAHLLVALLLVITLAGIAGSVCHFDHASLLLYWPVALLGAAAVWSFRPADTQAAVIGR